MSDQPKASDVERMNEIERYVMQSLGRFRENTEAAIVAGALLRIVRHLYDRYPLDVREQLLEGAIPFLQHGREVNVQEEAEVAAFLTDFKGMGAGKKRGRPN